MARALLPEDLWSMIEPLLPPDKPPKSNGRPAVPNRQALVGILFVMRTGIPGRTCRRKWAAAVV